MQRLYRVQDKLMIKKSEENIALFKNYHSDFFNFDKEFSEEYKIEWENIIEECKEIDNDNSVRLNQVQLTNEIKSKIEEVKFIYQCIKYFIEKAYKDDKAKLNEFGYYQYGKIGGSINSFVDFLTLLDSGLDKNYGELVLYGCPKEEMKQISDLKQDIDQLHKERSLKKNYRKSTTHNRIKKFNRCWEYSLKIKKAAKVIYRLDEKLMNEFLDA